MLNQRRCRKFEPPFFLPSVILIMAFAFSALAQAGQGETVIPPPPNQDPTAQSAWNLELVGYSDLQGRSTYQPIIIHQVLAHSTLMRARRNSREPRNALSIP